uniref:Uncharacterized protein n=1 Tax=Rhizophora mucronata TaxID=61149 RepID=A0A2P2IJJ9_RHIMU
MVVSFLNLILLRHYVSLASSPPKLYSKPTREISILGVEAWAVRLKFLCELSRQVRWCQLHGW